MKLGSFAAISRLVEERRDLQQLLLQKINVSIGERDLSASLANAIKPTVHVHLHVRIEQIEQELVVLGVCIDA